jgi:hypothetical protein
MMVRHAVQHHAASYPLLKAPCSHTGSLVVGRAVPVTAAGAAHEHLSVAFFGKIDIDVRVADIAHIAVSAHLYGSAEFIVLAGAEGYGDSVLNYALIDRLAFRIEFESNVRFDVLRQQTARKKGRKGP